MLHTKQTPAPVKTFAIGDRIVFYDYVRGDRGQQGAYQTVFATVVKANPKTLIADTKIGERYTTTRLAAQKIEDLF